MTLSRAVSDVVAEHTLIEIEAIDRLLLNLYVPTLQHPRALVGYVHTQLGLPIASTAPLAAVSARFEKAIGAFAAAQGIPVVHLIKGQRKDDVAHEYLKGFLASGRREGVLFIGRAQEKAPVFRPRSGARPMAAPIRGSSRPRRWSTTGTSTGTTTTSARSS